MKQKINDLIFKELIKRGYSLRGKTRVWNIADSKLWYLTSKQAQAYLDLEKSKDYGNKIFKVELAMLKKFFPEISEKILYGSSINVIDIGCGDGKKAVIPLEVLHSKKIRLRYCPIDISSYMVTQAIKRVKGINKGEVVDFRWNISDFDNLENISSLLRDKNFRQNLFLFLGDTISNFEIHEVMYEIVEAMNSGEDSLLIGLTLSNEKPEDLIKPYQSKLPDDFFVQVLTQLGFDRKNLEYGVRYENSRIEIIYTVKNPVKLSFEGKSVDFDKGDQLLVAISYRYSQEDLRRVMDIYFEEYKFYFNKDETKALILCKK